MSDSSSEDDMPLSSLVAKKRSRTVASYAEGSDDGDEEVEESEASGDFVEEDEDDGIADGDYAEDSDDSDDMPLSALGKEKKKNPKPVAKKKPTTEKKRSATKKSQSKSKPKPAKKTTKSVAKASVSAGNYVCASSELYMKSDKGKLIASILVRWYANDVCISDLLLD